MSTENLSLQFTFLPSPLPSPIEINATTTTSNIIQASAKEITPSHLDTLTGSLLTLPRPFYSEYCRAIDCANLFELQHFWLCCKWQSKWHIFWSQLLWANVAFSVAPDMKYQCYKRWWKFQKAMQCDESWRHIVLLGVNRHKRYMALLSVNDVTLPFVSRVTSRHLASLRWGGRVLQEIRRTITIYNFDSDVCRTIRFSSLIWLKVYQCPNFGTESEKLASRNDLISSSQGNRGFYISILGEW